MRYRSWWSQAPACGLVLVAWSCFAAAEGRPDPLDAQAAVPPAVHVSAFCGYRPAGEPRVGSWKEANDTVARIGGWRAYAREAAASAPAPAASQPCGAADHEKH